MQWEVGTRQKENHESTNGKKHEKKVIAGMLEGSPSTGSGQEDGGQMTPVKFAPLWDFTGQADDRGQMTEDGRIITKARKRKKHEKRLIAGKLEGQEAERQIAEDRRRRTED